MPQVTRVSATHLVPSLLALLLLCSGFAVVQAAPGDPGASPTPSAKAAPAERWVQTYRPTELWSGPASGAVSFGPLRLFSYLRVEAWQGNRLYVFNPRTNNFAFVDGSAVGPSGPPPEGYLTLGKPLV